MTISWSSFSREQSYYFSMQLGIFGLSSQSASSNLATLYLQASYLLVADSIRCLPFQQSIANQLPSLAARRRHLYTAPQH